MPRFTILAENVRQLKPLMSIRIRLSGAGRNGILVIHRQE